MGRLEWTFKNISHWNMDIHGEFFLCRATENIHLYFYPYGKDTTQGNLELCYDNIKRLPFPGPLYSPAELYHRTESAELIYENSKKSVVTIKLTKRCLDFQGPKFDEILADLRKNDTSQPSDKLIVRCLMKGELSGTFVSKISVWDTSLKMPSDILKNLPFSEKQPILNIVYNRENGKQDYLRVLASTLKDTFGMATVQLFLKPEFQVKVVSIHSYVSFPQCDGLPCVDGMADNVFYGEEHPVQKSGRVLVDKNALESFVLRLKIAPAHNYQGIELTYPHHQKRKVPDDLDGSTLSKDLMCLYQDQDFSDLQLKCDNVSFPVHKAILSTRSPVFKTMLSSDMQEAASGLVDIKDMDVPTVSLFLTYMYTGTVKELQSDSALKLYYAADKYQVHSLKKKCTDVLCANVSVENVCDILSLADAHQDEELTSAVHNVILDNYNEVLASEEWEDMMRRDPYLVSKTLTHFAKKNRVKKSLAQ